MKNTHQHFGEKSECLAAQYLQNKDFLLLARNYRDKHAEINIIAQKGTLWVFVEVKARSLLSNEPIGKRPLLKFPKGNNAA